MKNLYIVLFLFLFKTILAQSIFNMSDWLPGTGNITDFNMYGSETSNLRDYGYNHINDNVVLWNAIPDPESNLDGGLESVYKTINPNFTYRFTVWLKKTNSNDGSLYFGCNSFSDGTYNIQQLNGDQIDNPFFWSGDLPELNHWYLLIAYVHHYDYSGSSMSVMLDGETGEIINNISIHDFKFSPSANNLRIRVFQNATDNGLDRALIYKPFVLQSNSSNTNYAGLLDINLDSKLILNFDAEGNQNQRFYCKDSDCLIPVPESFTEEDIETIYKKGIGKNDVKSDDAITIYPNPTSSILNISFDKNINLKEDVIIYNANGQKVLEFSAANERVSADMSFLATGLYLIHFQLEDGTLIVKKIFKK